MVNESKFILLKLITLYCLIFLPAIGFAVEYTPLIKIPGLENINSTGFEKYLEIIYVLAIIGAAFIAVGKLLLAGLKYIGSATAPDKTDAKNDIKSAILGLIIILLATSILRTINPQLVKLTALPNAPSSQQLHRPRAIVINIGDNVDLSKIDVSITSTAKSCSENGGKLKYDENFDPTASFSGAPVRKVNCIKPVNTDGKFLEKLDSNNTTPEEKAELQKEYSSVVTRKEVSLSDQDAIDFIKQALLIKNKRGDDLSKTQEQYNVFEKKYLDQKLTPDESRYKANADLARSFILFINTNEPNNPNAQNIEDHQKTLCEKAGATYKNFKQYRVCF